MGCRQSRDQARRAQDQIIDTHNPNEPDVTVGIRRPPQSSAASANAIDSLDSSRSLAVDQTSSDADIHRPTPRYCPVQCSETAVEMQRTADQTGTDDAHESIDPQPTQRALLSSDDAPTQRQVPSTSDADNSLDSVSPQPSQQATPSENASDSGAARPISLDRIIDLQAREYNRLRQAHIQRMNPPPHSGSDNNDRVSSQPSSQPAPIPTGASGSSGSPSTREGGLTLAHEEQIQAYNRLHQAHIEMMSGTATAESCPQPIDDAEIARLARAFDSASARNVDTVVQRTFDGMASPQGNVDENAGRGTSVVGVTPSDILAESRTRSQDDPGMGSPSSAFHAVARSSSDVTEDAILPYALQSQRREYERLRRAHLERSSRGSETRHRRVPEHATIGTRGAGGESRSHARQYDVLYHLAVPEPSTLHSKPVTCSFCHSNLFAVFGVSYFWCRFCNRTNLVFYPICDPPADSNM